MTDLVRTTGSGLHCEAGGFHIDPWRPVERAVVTHAHADHTRPGSKRYLTTPEGAELVRLRTQEGAIVETLPYGESRRIGDVTVRFHPAGHVLGSAQVEVRAKSGETWVVAGDYKTEADPTCTPPRRCPRRFVTESTFGLPVFDWPSAESVAADVMDWWQENAAAGRTSLLCAYALGKSQRLLAGLEGGPGPIGVHGALHRLLPPSRAGDRAARDHLRLARGRRRDPREGARDRAAVRERHALGAQVRRDLHGLRPGLDAPARAAAAPQLRPRLRGERPRGLEGTARGDRGHGRGARARDPRLRRHPVRFLREERGLDAAPSRAASKGEGEAADEGTPAEADA